MPLLRLDDYQQYWALSVMPRVRFTIPERGAIAAMPQINSSTREPDQAPDMVPFTVGTIALQFWIHKDYERGLIQIMVKKATDPRPWNTCERYPVFTITSAGECYRNKGLPVDWNFRLTTERRIKEIR